MYNIVMFAYNEEKNIALSVKSVFESADDNLKHFFLIANGCTDKTVEVALSVKDELNFTKMSVVNLEIGDKCNAWNHYVHELATSEDVHFFVDADVKFSPNCFGAMHDKLFECPSETVAIAGLPLSGRNIEFYRSLVRDRSCFFGNLYGLRNSFITRVREDTFFLPKGLNWIDSFLTKAVNTDLQFFNYNLKNRVTYLDGVGYVFDSLSPLKRDDIKLYVNRIARYELGKIQEKHLDAIDVKQWPRDLMNLNVKIWRNFDEETNGLSFIKRRLVKWRLKKLLVKSNLL